jgi:hypothetical protein
MADETAPAVAPAHVSIRQHTSAKVADETAAAVARMYEEGGVSRSHLSLSLSLSLSLVCDGR